MRLRTILVLATSLGSASGLAAQTSSPQGSTNPQTAARHAPPPIASADAECRAGTRESAACSPPGSGEAATAPALETSKVTHHQATLDGRKFDYTATAGTLIICNDDGKPMASMFYVAYTAGDGRGSNRPVTFFYNGGPGSSSIWLHMGALAPMRVKTDSPAATHNAPFEMIPNADSLLDKSDLVFVDAVGTGFSRPVDGAKLADFWGTDKDIDAFARGIERYLTINDRWNSPKFIFGESYGTTRSAGLAYRLQKDGVQLNGVILLSSILNYGRRDPGFDRETVNYIPSYAAAAAYHGKIAVPPEGIMAFLQEVRAWAQGPYSEALAQGQNLPQAQRQAIAEQLSKYIGLPVDYVLEANLRVNPSRFRKELLRDQRLTLGRFDDRFTGVDRDAAGETPSYDPSDSGIDGAFVSAFHHYLTSELDYQTDLAYRPTYYQSGTRWNFTHRPPGARRDYDDTQADVALDLSAAMRENPHLQLLSLNGIYDLATPFFGTEYDLAHMDLDPQVRANIHFAYFPSGHMVYLNPAALDQMKTVLDNFYAEAAPGD